MSQNNPFTINQVKPKFKSAAIHYITDKKIQGTKAMALSKIALTLIFLTFLFLVIFSNQQANADCIVDGVQFDIGGRAGSGVTAVDRSNPITLAEIKQWDTTGDDVSTCDVSHLEELQRAFQHQNSFNQDIGSWDTSSVVNMQEMFGNATSFNQNISGWDTSSLSSTASMFGNATSFNQNISGWDTSSVVNMNYMFYGASSFNQNIFIWDISSVTKYSAVFNFATEMISTYSNFISSDGQIISLDAFSSSPTLSSSTPADNATNVALDANIVLNFSENVTAQSGNITIKKTSDNSIIETISVAGGQVTGTGTSQITINPSSNFDANTGYYVLIAASAFDDADGGSYAGISSTTSLNFTSTNVLPTLSSSTPADDATSVAIDTNIVLNFSENVTAQSGNIIIYKTDGSTVETIDVAGGQVTGTGTSQITINPSSNFEAETEYYVLIDGTAFDDTGSGSYAGISSTTALSFSVESMVDPTTDKDTTGSIDAQSTQIQSTFIKSISTVSTRLSYLRQNRSRDNFAKNNIKLEGGNVMLTSLVKTISNSNTISPKLNLTKLIPDNWSPWSEGSISLSKIKNNSSEIESQSLAFGFDRKLNNNNLLGFAIQYGQSDTDIGTSGTGIDSKNYNLSLYQTRPLNDDNFIEGLIGVGIIEKDLTRISGDNTLTGSRKGAQIFGSINYGKTIDKGDFNLTPIARVDLGYTELDAYSEIGTDALSYDKQTVESGMVSLGLEFNDIINFSNSSFKPFGLVEYGLDFSNSSDVQMNYVSDTSTTYTYTQSVNSTHLLTSEVGFNYEALENLNIKTSYKRIQGNENEHIDTVKFSFKFKSRRETEYAMSLDGNEDLKTGFDITKNINGLNLSFNANQSFNETFDREAKVSLSSVF